MKTAQTYITPYAPYSKSAKLLTRALNLKRGNMGDLFNISRLSKSDREYYGYVLPEKILNWGYAGNKVPQGAKIFNQPDKVAIASNKIKFFTTMGSNDGARTPDFTTDVNVATTWVEEGEEVFGREKRGSCGLDIVTFSSDPVKFTNSDFWVKYKKKKHEFRIHIVNGVIIDRQQKLLRSTDADGNPIDKATVNFKIRNHRNGFVFARNEINVPEDVDTQALLAVKAIGLDFGAVDVIYNQYEGKAYVLEVNTAPGLEGTTLTNYTKALGELIA